MPERRRGGELEPIVEGPQCTEPEHAEDGEVDVEVSQVGQQEHADEDGGEDEDSTHGGDVGLVLGEPVEGGVVKLGAVAELHADEPAD